MYFTFWLYYHVMLLKKFVHMFDYHKWTVQLQYTDQHTAYQGDGIIRNSSTAEMNGYYYH